jgi:hypothetical protein
MGKISLTTDVWSDPNLTSFMAVTAHWIEGVEVKTMAGIQKKLEMRADLIGFHMIPGRHTGKHLAHCFHFILEQLKITQKACLSLLHYLATYILIDWMDNL